QCLRCVKQTQDNLQAFQGIMTEHFPDRNTDVLRELDGLDVLQICLLQTEPFDCAAAMIKNMHTGQKLPCPDRPILLSSLAEALASLQPPYWWLLIALELELKDPKVFTEIRSFIDIYFKTYFAYQSYEGSAPNSDIKRLQ